MIQKIKRYEINEDDTGTLRETAPGQCSSEHSGGAFLCCPHNLGRFKRCMNAAFVLAVLYKAYLYASKCRIKVAFMLAVLYKAYLYASKCRPKAALCLRRCIMAAFVHASAV